MPNCAICKKPVTTGIVLCGHCAKSLAPYTLPVGTTYFQGTPGVSYRVTLTVYARNSKGSDTGYITSYTIVCK